MVAAEPVPVLVQWNRGPMAHLAGNPLADDRVSVRESDVVDVLKSSKAQHDAIILDVDNRPDGLTRKEDEWIYGPNGLSVALKAIQPGGVPAIWSAAPDIAFAKRLRRIGFQVEE